MPDKMNYQEALRYSMNLCSKQERCKSEICEKLLKSGLQEANIDKVLSALENDGFINESRYASMFASDKLRLNRWGRIKIRYMLHQKKIPGEIISRALDEMNMDEYYEALKQELAKKKKTIHSDNPWNMRNKLFLFALQRGFESELIQKVIDSELG